MATKAALRYKKYLGCLYREVRVAAKWLNEPDDIYQLWMGEPLNHKGKHPYAVVWMVWVIREAYMTKYLEQEALEAAKDQIRQGGYYQRGIKNYITLVYVVGNKVMYTAPGGVKVELIRNGN